MSSSSGVPGKTKELRGGASVENGRREGLLEFLFFLSKVEAHVEGLLELPLATSILVAQLIVRGGADMALPCRYKFLMPARFQARDEASRQGCSDSVTAHLRMHNTDCESAKSPL